jgi:hypothetical protein
VLAPGECAPSGAGFASRFLAMIGKSGFALLHAQVCASATCARSRADTAVRAVRYFSRCRPAHQARARRRRSAKQNDTAAGINLRTIENRKLAWADRRPQPTFAAAKGNRCGEWIFSCRSAVRRSLASVVLAGTIREQGFRDFIQGWLIGRRRLASPAAVHRMMSKKAGSNGGRCRD